MTMQEIKDIAGDYQQASRWAALSIVTAEARKTVNLRIISIRRNTVRVMHANGTTRLVQPEDIEKAW